MLKRSVKKQLEEKQNELQMNLANNYKDLANDALKELDQLVEALRASGDLKDKDYQKQRSLVDDYKRQLVGYGHTKI